MEDADTSGLTLDGLIAEERKSRRFKRGISKRDNNSTRGRTKRLSGGSNFSNRFRRGRGRGSARGGGRGRNSRGRNNYNNRGRSRGGGRGRGRGFHRNSDNDVWKHDKFNEVKSRRSNYQSRSSHQTTLKNKRFQTQSGLQVSVGSTNEYIIRVSGLHDGVKAEDLLDIFRKFGSVIYAYIIFRDDNTHSGIAQVCFANSENAKQAAADLDGASIDSCQVKIQYLGDGSINKYRNYSTGRTSGNQNTHMDDNTYETNESNFSYTPRHSNNNNNNSNNNRRKDGNFVPGVPKNPLAR